MAIPRRKYTNEMKLNAAHLVKNEGRRACDVADELGIERNSLYAWLDPLANLPAKSHPSRPRSEVCEPNLPALVRSARS